MTTTQPTTVTRPTGAAPAPLTPLAQEALNAPPLAPAPIDAPLKADVKAFSFYYGEKQALKNVNMPIAEKRVTALIGPSGCGKSTLLRSFNRMHDLYAGNRYEGQVILHPDGVDLVSKDMDPMEVRMRVGMVFQKPNPFPKSIYENVVFGLRIRGVNDKAYLDHVVEKSLRGASLWEETKDRLNQSGVGLSGGQQQRLCIARALATEPEILLLDEPTSALDPQSTIRIEDLVTELRQRLTIVIVTHNMQQAARVADYTAVMYLGQLIEFDKTSTIFTQPNHKLTERYVTGHFG